MLLQAEMAHCSAMFCIGREGKMNNDLGLQSTLIAQDVVALTQKQGS